MTGGKEADWVSRAGIRLRAIPAGGLHGVSLLNSVRNAWKLTRGLRLARRYLAEDRPDAIFTTGGYVSGPVAVAAKWRHVPLLLYLPDIEPGQAVRAVARHAALVGVTVEDSRPYFAGKKVLVSGYPLRRELTRWDRAAARSALQVSPEGRVVLVFGGSLGARSINQALLAQLTALLPLAEVIHISGTRDWPWVEAESARLPAELRRRYHAVPYLHEKMGAALAAADLVVCRAGASVLGELPYFGLPAVLVPYPYAWRYQRVNAEWLAKRQAAVVLADADLPTELLPTVQSLLEDDSRRRRMAEAARKLARPDAAQKLAVALRELGVEDSPWSR